MVMYCGQAIGYGEADARMARGEVVYGLHFVGRRNGTVASLDLTRGQAEKLHAWLERELGLREERADSRSVTS